MGREGERDGREREMGGRESELEEKFEMIANHLPPPLIFIPSLSLSLSLSTFIFSLYFSSPTHLGSFPHAF